MEQKETLQKFFNFGASKEEIANFIASNGNDADAISRMIVIISENQEDLIEYSVRLLPYSPYILTMRATIAVLNAVRTKLAQASILALIGPYEESAAYQLINLYTDKCISKKEFFEATSMGLIFKEENKHHVLKTLEINNLTKDILHCIKFV